MIKLFFRKVNTYTLASTPYVVTSPLGWSHMMCSHFGFPVGESVTSPWQILPHEFVHPLYGALHTHVHTHVHMDTSLQQDVVSIAPSLR